VTIRVRPGEEVRVEVEDLGPGIPAEHAPRLFERFFRVPGPSLGVRGTGLGLYICRKIVEAHGGVIGLESSQPSGSRFFFTLPNLTAMPESSPGGAHEPEENHLGRG
jgi:signal transduction histidine kinase